MRHKYSFVFFCVLLLLGCRGERKRPIFYDSEMDSYADTTKYSYEANPKYTEMFSANTIPIPFTERGGVKFVKVSVNGFGFEMIFDTGCSGTLISVAEANYLYQKGYLTQDDILGLSHAQIADGSIVENMVVNLKEVIIDGQIICLDVTATVSANTNAPLLLGNEVLNRVAAYSVDNENKIINFKLK